MDVPETRYLKTPEGVHLAYQVAGDGPLDVVFLQGAFANQGQLAWEVDAFAHVFERIASFGRLILFDAQGSGLSDPRGRFENPSIESSVNDLLSVLDGVGSERTAVIANATAGLLAIFFAASYPNRTAALVLDGCYARLAEAPDYPWGLPHALLDAAVARVEHDPGSFDGSGLRYTAPNAMRDPHFAAQYERFWRVASSGPATAVAAAEMLVYSDLRQLLPAIQAPTLVLYRQHDKFAGRPHAQYLATHIEGAKLVELPGEDTLTFVGDSDAVVDEIEEFLTGTRRAAPTDRVLATVLFTDIVSSTQRAAELGDKRWRELIDAHDRTTRRQLERFRGREINTAGDGFLATFDGPGRAIECACAIRDAMRPLDLEVRAGLHTGEIELRGSDVAGIAVHIGARVAALAGAGEVLVSGAIPPLVAGSGIMFDDRGEHDLKGVPGTWKVFAVRG